RLAVLGVFLGSRDQLPARLLCGLGRSGDSLGRVLRVLVRNDDGGLHRRTAQTKVSRFPLGPGRPDSARPRISNPAAPAAAITESTASARSSGSRTTPPRTLPFPSSNCGLTIAHS